MHPAVRDDRIWFQIPGVDKAHQIHNGNPASGCLGSTKCRAEDWCFCALVDERLKLSRNGSTETDDLCGVVLEPDPVVADGGMHG